jgi:hypothetical protein
MTEQSAQGAIAGRHRLRCGWIKEMGAIGSELSFSKVFQALTYSHMGI